MHTLTRISQHLRPEFWELVTPGIITAESWLGFESKENTADLSNLQISPWKFSLVVKILNLKNQQVVLGWLHRKFPIWGRKIILPETTVTHCKEIHSQSTELGSTHREPRVLEDPPDWLFSWLCHLLLVWPWPWGCLPGLIFSDMNTFIIHDSEQMYTRNFV